MADMTFKANLLPNTDLGYSLGSSTQRWNIYGTCDGYLPLSGGTMTGGINLVGNQSSAYNDKGLVFTDNSRIGENSSGDLGLYGARKVFIRPNSASAASSTGIEVNDTEILPGTNNTESLGSSSKKWLNVYATTFHGDLDGSAKTLASLGTIGSSSTTHATALQGWFDSNKATTPRNQLIHFYDASNGNGSATFGYFLNGYDSNPYGGFFCAHYDTPYYIGIKNGTYTNQTILTSSNYTTYTVTKTGSGASGTWGISISGNAATATKLSTSGTAAKFWRGDNAWSDTISGGTLKITNNSNTVTIGSTNSSWCHFTNSADIPFYFGNSIGIPKGKTIGFSNNQYRPFQIYLGYNTTSDSRALDSNNPLIEFANSGRGQYAQIVYTDYNNQGGSDSFTFVSNQSDLRVYAPKVHGAVWNDYAEYRQSNETEPGRCIRETGNGDLILTTERLQKGCEIISDTFGFSIGESPTCKTPTAASGRVLAYLYEDNEIAKQHIGDPVCSGPNGTVSIMTEEEEMRYSSRIIGTISEIPNYDIWYAGADGKLEIPVNGRIWIRIR